MIRLRKQPTGRTPGLRTRTLGLHLSCDQSRHLQGLASGTIGSPAQGWRQGVGICKEHGKSWTWKREQLRKGHLFR